MLDIISSLSILYNFPLNTSGLLFVFVFITSSYIFNIIKLIKFLCSLFPVLSFPQLEFTFIYIKISFMIFFNFRISVGRKPLCVYA